MGLTMEDIQCQLDRMERNSLIAAKSVLNIEEAAVFTGLSRSYLYSCVWDRRIPHYKKGRKLYFKKSELEDWLLEDRIIGMAEVDSLAAAYLTLGNHRQKLTEQRPKQ